MDMPHSTGLAIGVIDADEEFEWLSPRGIT